LRVSPLALASDAAYERFQDTLLSQDLPELERALRRGVGLAELRQACVHLNARRCLLPLTLPAIVADDVARPISALRVIADELRAMLVRHQPPREDKAVPVIEAILDWVARLEAESPQAKERQRDGCGCAQTLCSASRRTSRCSSRALSRSAAGRGRRTSTTCCPGRATRPPAGPRLFRRRFRAVLIDEFQDTDPVKPSWRQ
jgi:hypothetical protein